MAELRAVLFIKKTKTNEWDTFSSLTTCLTSAEGTFHQAACTFSRAATLRENDGLLPSRRAGGGGLP